MSFYKLFTVVIYCRSKICHGGKYVQSSVHFTGCVYNGRIFCKVDTRGMYYKISMTAINYVLKFFDSVNYFNPSLTFVGTARSLPLEWSPITDPTWVPYSVLKYMEVTARNKHSSLLRHSIHYSCKSYIMHLHAVDKIITL